MNNSRSPPLTSGKICIISPADPSPHEMMATAKQDRSVAPAPNAEVARRGFVHRNLSACRPDRRRIAPTWRTGWWPRLLCRLAAFLVVAAPVLATTQSQAQASQQGSKLVGTFAVDPAYQGSSVALSADGNTAMVGGLVDDKLNGAGWVFTRSGSIWTQQGSKLVGTGAVGPAGQGSSLALSADGNTALVGGPYDNRSTGAAWVYTRNGGVWTQDGSKLVGFGALEAARQGATVALSADGNTAIVGGPYDNSFAGAVWVFTRNGGVWTQQGSKLVGTGGIESSRQGSSVALSADGNTAIVGAIGDNWYAGAAWVFIRSGTVWTQQGSKLVGTGAVGNVFGQGTSVALSADGNTAIVGGVGDNSYTGAAWVFTRSGTVWTQQGSKLVGTGAIGKASQAHSVALSADGNTAIISGPRDNSSSGATWVFTRSGTVWIQQGSKLVGAGAVGNARQGSSLALSADGNTVIVGGMSDNMMSGAAWVHSRSGTVWTQQYVGF